MTAGIRPIDDDAQLAAAWPVVRLLRPHLDRSALLAAVAVQRAEGYLSAGAYLDDQCVAFAGYRIQSMLAHGRVLYVDDLVSAEAHRGSGHGRALLAWLVDEARRAGCQSLQLDSGSHRLDAHAFYFRFGLRITSFHFALPLEPSA